MVVCSSNSYQTSGLNKTTVNWSGSAKSIIRVCLPDHQERTSYILWRQVATVTWLSISCLVFCSFGYAHMVLPQSAAEEARLSNVSTMRESLLKMTSEEVKGERALRVAQSNQKRGTKLQTAPLIVMIGASFAEGWDLAKIERLSVVNKGVSGETSSEMLARFDRDVVALRPTHVIIWGFINDIHRSERNTIDATLERTRKNYRMMVVLTRLNGIVPILGTELTIFGIKGYSEKIKIFLLEKIVQKESYRTYVNKHVLHMNEWLKSLAREEKLMVVDFNRALSGKDGVRKEEYTTPDGTHISSEGYQELTRYTNQALKDQVR